MIQPVHSILVLPDRIMLIQKQQQHPQLVSHLCSQKQYLSENQIRQVAKQLISLLIQIRTAGVFHLLFDFDCLLCKEIDYKNDTIEIEVVGFNPD